MHNDDYQELPAISSHWLKDMLISPDYCWQQHLDPQRPLSKPSAAMQFGTLVHCLTLTPLQLGQEFVIETLPRQGKARQARQAQLAEAGLTAITPDEFNHAQAMVAALRANPAARSLLTGGQKEHTIIQPRAPGLLPLKARLDLHHPDQQLVVELKTIHSLDAIDRAIKRYRYALSAAFYCDLVNAERLVFIFVQSREPYEVAVFELSRLELQDGRELYRYALCRFDDCWQSQHWPEADSITAEDDDPLLMPLAAMITPKGTNHARFDLPVGELAL